MKKIRVDTKKWYSLDWKNQQQNDLCNKYNSYQNTNIFVHRTRKSNLTILKFI